MKQFDMFRLDTCNECLWRESAQILLAPKPFAILRYLVENPGRLITHDELLDTLWPETYVQPQVLRTYMLELRKVLGDDAAAPRFIQTLPKRGYCFLADVRHWDGVSPRDDKRLPLRVAVPAGFVDRDAELARLNDLAKLAWAGERQVVFVTGASGIGKSALADAYARQAAVEGVMVARGQCVEGLGSREEFYPVMEALAQLCTSAGGDAASRQLARLAPLWLPALHRSAEAAGAAKPAESAPNRLPGDLCVALEELAREKPLLLLFEDLQWADAATVSLFSALARRRTPARLMVMATMRRQESQRELSLKELKQDLLMRRIATELALQPLGKVAVRSLIRVQLKQVDYPDGLDDFVYGKSEGNPLFVIATLEHLIGERVMVRAASEDYVEWKQVAPFPDLGIAVPDQLAQMIELEIERLDSQDQRLLEAASLMHVVFPAWAVAASLQQDTAETEDQCDDIARRLYFVHRAGEDELPDGTRCSFYVFAHGMYREVLYRRQAAAQRDRRHARIAARMAELFAGREASVGREIALHYEAAGQWQLAAAALQAGARHARERGAHREASSLLDHALRLAGNLGDRERFDLADAIRAQLGAARDAAQAAHPSRNTFEKLDDFWTGT